MDETHRNIPSDLPQTTREPARSTALKRRQTLEIVDRWCRARGYRTLSPTASVLEQYVEAHVGLLSYLTLKTRVEHMRAVYRAAGVPWPEDDRPIRSALAKARAYGTHRAAEPLRERDLVDLSRRLTAVGDPAAAHDWALIALGADGGLDATELGELRPEDLTFEPDAVVARVAEHRPWLGDVRLPRRDDRLRCPVEALAVWGALRQDARTFFHTPGGGGACMPLSAHRITSILQRRMAEIGRNGAAYSWLSLRATRLLAQLAPARGDR